MKSVNHSGNFYAGDPNGCADIDDLIRETWCGMPVITYWDTFQFDCFDQIIQMDYEW